MRILVLNAGSSSVKYSLFEMLAQSVLITGLIERIGELDSEHSFSIDNTPKQHVKKQIANHQQALQELFSVLNNTGILSDSNELFCIGNRVVHGGEQFRQPTQITQEVLTQISATSVLAPLHNPANLLGIEEAIRQMGNIPQVAVFDTAFHHTLPEYAFRYALPSNLYTEHGVRRYGFHGASHSHVAKQAAKFLKKDLLQTNLITLHLGNGASVTAIENGCSVDTSMGMTPLEGLMMGTRSGDIDPAIHFFLDRSVKMSNKEIETLLNKNSGCKGICQENDMRTIHEKAEAGDKNAMLALEMYAYRVKKYIGAYFAVLGHVDALVFTGGIGENDFWLREKCCANLQRLGICIEDSKNRHVLQPCSEINSENSDVSVLVIATNEELEIAIQARSCIEGLNGALGCL